MRNVLVFLLLCFAFGCGNSDSNITSTNNTTLNQHSKILRFPGGNQPSNVIQLGNKFCRSDELQRILEDKRLKEIAAVFYEEGGEIVIYLGITADLKSKELSREEIEKIVKSLNAGGSPWTWRLDQMVPHVGDPVGDGKDIYACMLKANVPAEWIEKL